MMKSVRKKKLTVRSRLQSLSHASSGLCDMLLTEPNAWLHAIATAVVVFISWWLQIDQTSFAFIIFAIVGVWMAEAFNTVLELTVDIVTSEQHSLMAKRAKDIAAAAVLIATIGATLIGLIILGPPLLTRLGL